MTMNNQEKLVKQLKLLSRARKIEQDQLKQMKWRSRRLDSKMSELVEKMNADQRVNLVTEFIIKDGGHELFYRKSN